MSRVTIRTRTATACGGTVAPLIPTTPPLDSENLRQFHTAVINRVYKFLHHIRIKKSRSAPDMMSTASPLAITSILADSYLHFCCHYHLLHWPRVSVSCRCPLSSYWTVCPEYGS